MMTKSELPEAYKIGSIPFVHAEIYLDSRPLIPRTETEYWVDLAIKDIRASGIKSPKILDLCAGSGCIGVAVGKDIPEALVDFVELDTRHHPTIERNLKENGVKGRVFGGDLFEKITDKYDFILSNPPYIDRDLDRVAESVKDHEPELALYGGEKGLEVVERIITESSKHLNPGGKLYIEHEPEQSEFISKKIRFIETIKDQFGTDRVSVLQN